MLYLIGRVPRVRKSTLANLILERNKISYVDTDWIVNMLMFAAPQQGVQVTDKKYIGLWDQERTKISMDHAPQI
jgi:cytidylate kinase